MSTFGSKVFTGSILAVIGLFTVKLLLWLVGGVMAVGSFLLFTVLPIVLIGWLVLKAIKYIGRDKPAMD